MDLLTRADFAPHLGTEFHVVFDDGTFPLTLHAVEGSKYPPMPGMDHTGRPFSLVFRGRSQNPLPNRTWTLRHTVMGELDVFLVPVARDGEHYLYEAVFN